ncbi:MAG TPA: LiaF domain-containing protein [Ktedonobacterales bacterium]|nr:LiaF domain-containing protein [Ktedonobacterales bacterium]
MQMQSSQPSATPQQEAMRVLRERYERGEIAFEAFQRGLDALLMARDADECQAIMNGLPTLPVSKLDQLDALSQPSPSAVPLRRRGEPKRLVAFLSEVKRVQRAWRLDPDTTGGAILGEMKLDLNLAALPPHATMTLSAVFGQLTIYVPTTARVRVRASAFMGEVTIFGESSGGIFVSDEVTSEGSTPDHPEATTIDLDLRAVFGEVKVIQGENPSLFKKISAVVRRIIAEPEPGRLSNPL